MRCNRAEDSEKKKAKDKRLAEMSLDELRIEYNLRIKSEIAMAIQKLPERIDAHLEKVAWGIITATLGVKKDGWSNGRWEIDEHCDGTALAKALGDHVLVQIKQAIPGFIEGLLVDDPRVPPIKAAYTRAYKMRLAELLHDELYVCAQKNAEKRFTEILGQITGEKHDIVFDED